MIRTIGHGGINWNWYLCGDFNDTDKTVYVFYYDRWHKYEYRGTGHPKGAEWNVRMTLYESENGRVLQEVRLSNEVYRVLNPADIFSYRDMTHYISE